jgi:hypothetical protein
VLPAPEEKSGRPAGGARGKGGRQQFEKNCSVHSQSTTVSPLVHQS